MSTLDTLEYPSSEKRRRERSRAARGARHAGSRVVGHWTRGSGALIATIMVMVQGSWICSHRLETWSGRAALSLPRAHHCAKGGRIAVVLRLRGGLYGSESSDPGSEEQDIIAELEGRTAGLQSNHSIARYVCMHIHGKRRICIS